MEKKDWFKSILVYSCITFFIITVVFVYMSFRGKPQAGLIEVSCSATLFVIFLYVIKNILPKAESIITTILSILLAVFFVIANYYLQLNENENYSIKQILIGDLLAKKLLSDKYDETYKIPSKDIIKKIRKNEFTKITTTEKYTLESQYEKPKKIKLSENYAKLPIDEPYKSDIKRAKIYNIEHPDNKVKYKLNFEKNESLLTDINPIIDKNIEDFPYKNLSPKHLYKLTDYPSELNLQNFKNIFINQDKVYLHEQVQKLYFPVDNEYSFNIINNQIVDGLNKP